MLDTDIDTTGEYNSMTKVGVDLGTHCGVAWKSVKCQSPIGTNRPNDGRWYEHSDANSKTF